MSKKREESKISILKINDDLDNTSQLSDSYTTFKSNSSINLSESKEIFILKIIFKFARQIFKINELDLLKIC